MPKLHGLWLKKLVPAFALLILVAGCSSEPEQPRLSYFSPTVMLVPTEEALRVRIVYERNDFNDVVFAWSAEAGTVEGDGSASAIYTAPSEPGQYAITVTATYGMGEEAGETELTSVIRVIPGPTWEIREDDDPVAATDEARAGAESDTSVAGTEPQANAEPSEVEETAADTNTAEESSDAAADTDTAGDADTAAEAEQIAPAAAASSEGDAGEVVPATPSALDRILADGRLIATVQADFPPFSFENDQGTRTGFDIDLAREFARRWLDDASAIELRPVPSPQRITTLLDGEADIVVAALTATTARDEQVDFSLTYFKDGQRLLVADGADIVSVCDLAGEPVAAIAATTSLDNFLAAAGECGFDGNENLAVFDNHEQAVAALVAGEVTAFTGDSIALERFAEDRPLQVVGNHFSDEPYVVAVTEGDRRLQELVNATLVAMNEDGTFAGIYQEWFGDSIAPFPLDEPVLDTDPADLDALITSNAPVVVEPSTESGDPISTYVVQPGDSLSGIAGKVFGDVGPDSWRRLYEANREVIGEDPSRIEVGMTLTIPR